MQTHLSIQNFSVKRGDFYLNPISFDIQKGEIFSILGKTGSGKTVLLESILGMHKGSCGSIYLNNQNIHTIPMEKRNIGIVYQDYQLFPCMNVYDNITYGLRMKGETKQKIKQVAQQFIDLFDLTSIQNQAIHTISGGECQRVALARTLCVKPQILLLDEPFSALDPATKQQMYQILISIHQKFACTIIFVTHDFKEAMTLSDRVAILLHGQLKAILPSNQLMTYSYCDQDVNRFLGRTLA